jgi:tetratricopeptide (TPR) repeat protein/tRNA A-37 threonylcarbamoyl transferase component Bud32
MECLEAEQIAAWMDQELSGAGREAVEEHVEGCQACRALLIELTRDAGYDSGTRPSTPALPASVGERIGRYVVLSWLGSGGMGTVYVAYDPDLDRTIALKLLRPDGTDATEPSIALREAKALAKVAHPNVISIHDAGTHLGRVFLAMELVRGVNLSEWIRRERPTASRLIARFAEAGRGLAAVHAAGLVHGDFKPDNVLVDASGRVRVTDFGLARPEGDLQVPGARRYLVGTPRYMSPEQRAGRVVTAQSDQYSFCVALSDALAEQRRVPARARRCLARGLREKPEERFATLDDLLAVLQPPRNARRWAMISAVGSVLAALGLVFVGGRLREHRQREACAHVDRQLSGVWDSPRRASLVGAFDGVATVYAHSLGSRVARVLDEYADRWIAARSASCRMAQASPAVDARSDPRMVCLDARLAELKALVDELPTLATPEGASRAIVVAQSLQPVGRCAQDAAHGPVPRGMADPEHAAGADAVRASLARAFVLNELRRYSEAVLPAQRAVERAEAMHDDDLTVQALLMSGNAHGGSGNRKVAEEELFRAIAIADSLGDDTGRQRAWALLLNWATNFDDNDRVQPRRWFDQAMALVTRTGGDPDAEAQVRLAYGTSLVRASSYGEARDQFQKAIDAQERSESRYPLSNLQEWLAIACSNSGAYAEADRAFDRAIAAARESFGDDHPRVADVLTARAADALERERFDAALQFAQQASTIEDAAGVGRSGQYFTQANLAEALLELRRYDEALPVWLRLEGEPGVSGFKRREFTVLCNLGRSYLGLSSPDRAAPLLERALSLEATPHPEYSADAQFALAQALALLRKEPQRANALAQAAKTLLDGIAPRSALQESKRRAVSAWLGDARP